MDCIFCKIADNQIPAAKLYEDDHVLAFRDLHPQAPAHLLVIPRRHIASLAAITPQDRDLLGHLLLTASTIAREQNLARGYRVVINTGEDGGQTVDHLHLHILGERAMGWPPG